MRWERRHEKANKKEIPLRTFVTKRTAWSPKSTTVISQGPLMSGLWKVSTTLPLQSRTMRHPGMAVTEVPLKVGKDPTITQPFFRTTNAVVRPTPPGHQSPNWEASRWEEMRSEANIIRRTLPLIWAKSFCCEPSGGNWTIVVPVPCWFAMLLKLETRISPSLSLPRLSGTTNTPYGFTSPGRRAWSFSTF